MPLTVDSAATEWTSMGPCIHHVSWYSTIYCSCHALSADEPRFDSNYIHVDQRETLPRCLPRAPLKERVRHVWVPYGLITPLRMLMPRPPRLEKLSVRHKRFSVAPIPTSIIITLTGAIIMAESLCMWAGIRGLRATSHRHMYNVELLLSDLFLSLIFADFWLIWSPEGPRVLGSAWLNAGCSGCLEHATQWWLKRTDTGGLHFYRICLIV